MKKKWINKGDNVLVIAGNDKGKVGKVLETKEDRILIQGVNIRKRHMKSRQQDQKSEILNLEKPIHVSNVSLCDQNGKKMKLNKKVREDGSKDLVSIFDSKEKTHRTLRKPISK
tara:strand:+ start:207 stop:548 length:342 start_codon:yes stop_codon:yes gene_type:complete